MDTVEEIKAKLSIEDVVSPFVQLRKTGSSFKGLCPFHNEKTPSFVVSPDKGLAYCFGCRKGGDIFAFIQELENIDFPEAIKLLAEKAGVEVKKSNKKKHTKQEKEQLIEILQASQEFFQQQLTQNNVPLQYLANRGYPLPKANQFQLGFAPDDFQLLILHLKSKGYSSQELVNAGIAAQKEITGNPYSRFRNRITFPIHNAQGTLIGFGGRILPEKKGVADPERAEQVERAKYLNSPETTLYHKRANLYLFHIAKEHIKKTDKAIIVEGYFDALTSHVTGYQNTVASLGTALTEEQLKLVKRFTTNIAFAFDADQSGQEAAVRSIELAQQMGFSISIIRVPQGKDPDDTLRTQPDLWDSAIANALPIMEFHKQRSIAAYGKGTIEGKKRILQDLLPVISHFQNAMEREHHLQQLSLELQVSIASLQEEMQKTEKSSTIRSPHKKEITPEKTTYSRTEYLLGVLINAPKLSSFSEDILQTEIFPEGAEKRLYTQLKASYTEPGEISLMNIENPQDKQHLQLLALYTEQKYGAFEEKEMEREVTNLCNAINKENKTARLRSLRFQLAQLEQETETRAIKKQYKNIMEEYARLLKSE